MRRRFYPALVLTLGSLLSAGQASAKSVDCKDDETYQGLQQAHDALMYQLIGEAVDHRYEICNNGSECLAHIRALAGEVDEVDAASAERCPPGDAWTDHIEGLVDPRQQPEGTLWQYRDDPQRQALHEAIIAAMLADAPPGQAQPTAVLTMGGPGSGKSHTLSHLGLCQSDVILVDPDRVKHWLAEYQAAMAGHDRLAADRVHRESSMVAKALRDHAIEARHELCIDGVLSKKASALELVGRLQSAGYSVKIVAVYVPFEVAWARIVQRGEETGRFVPRDYAEDAHARILEHFDEVLRAADSGLVYDTNVPAGAPPKFLREYRDGELIEAVE